jgi:hypothetical protein
VSVGRTGTSRPADRVEPTSNDILAMGCREQQESGFFSFVTSIRNRRFPIVDRERGLVLAWCFSDQTGAVAELRLSNGKTIPSV